MVLDSFRLESQLLHLTNYVIFSKLLNLSESQVSPYKIEIQKNHVS